MFKKICSLLILTTIFSTYSANNPVNPDMYKQHRFIATKGTSLEFKEIVPKLSQEEKNLILSTFFDRSNVLETEKISALQIVALHNPNLSILPLITQYYFAMLYHNAKTESLNAPVITKNLQSKIEKVAAKIDTATEIDEKNKLREKLTRLENTLKTISAMVEQNQNNLQNLAPLIKQFSDSIKQKFSL